MSSDREGADGTSAPPPAAAPAQGPGRVVGTFLLLLLFVGALWSIAQGFLVTPVDGEAKQREYFGERPPPGGLALESATRLPTGDALVRFRRSGEGPGPEEAVFIEYRSRAAVEALFRPSMEGMGMEAGPGGRVREWEKDPSFAWHFTMKRDEIAWGQWSSKLWIERAFAKGGGWREEARVDLSNAKRSLVLFAHWPSGVAVDERELGEFLSVLELGEPPAAH